MLIFVSVHFFTNFYKFPQIILLVREMHYTNDKHVHVLKQVIRYTRQKKYDGKEEIKGKKHNKF